MQERTDDRTRRERHDEPDGFFDRLRLLFVPGPFSWIAGSVPRKPRFHAGQHMHGLQEHDINERPLHIEREPRDPPRDRWGAAP